MIGLSLCALFFIGCSPSNKQGDQTPVFREAAAEYGLNFVHENGRRGNYYMPEIMGAGGALLDYDQDGDLDVFLCQGFTLGMDSPHKKGGRLFRNTLIPSGQLGFEDVTQTAGIQAFGYGMGAAVGDLDNNGFPDLYLTNFGSNQLLMNMGNGRFEDRTQPSRADDDRWSVSATFLDYDRDGNLDLFIGNYVNFTVENHKDCYHGQKDYCHPLSYQPHPDRLLRNLGDGTFQDVTAASGMIKAYGNGLGVATADFNRDGWIDLYVANDGTPNQCWINTRDGGFQDTALIAGCALNHSGFAEAGMGVDAADFDNDGDEDLFVTHLTGQTNTIYVNNGSGIFEDQTIQSGLGAPSTSFTGFGTAWLDFDNDGLKDILSVNGSVTAIGSLAGDPFPYHQTNQLFKNLGQAQFEDVTANSGMTHSEVSRGALFGDIDNDGDIDAIISNNNGPVRLLLNGRGNANHWIGLSILESHGRHALGALVRISQGKKHVFHRVTRNASYASAGDPRILSGLGSDPGPCNIKVIWPDGSLEYWSNIEANQWRQLQKGSGKPDPSSSEDP